MKANSIEVEAWRPVAGFEHLYEVSSAGRVRSKDAHVKCGRGGSSVRLREGRVLRAGAQRSGHLTVAITQGNSRLVHSLVMEAFVGCRPHGFDIAHLDGDPTNNSLGNLKYVSRSENIRHNHAHGRTKVSPEGAREVRDWRLTPVKDRTMTLRGMATKFGVSAAHLYNIANGRAYRADRD